MKSIGMSASKKRKAGTSSPAKQKGKSTSVKVEKKSVEGTLLLAKKKIIKTPTKKKAISLGTNQYSSSSPILIDESPQVLPKDYSLSVLVDAANHTIINKENMEK